MTSQWFFTVIIYSIWAVFLALALISIMFYQVLVERLSGLPEAASRYSWIFTSLLSSDMLVQVFFLIFTSFPHFYFTILFRYAGSGIFPIDFPGQLWRAAVAILVFFCHFFFFLPFVGYTSPIDRHGWQMIWSLLTICTRNPVLLHRSDISISISVNMFQNSKIVKILKSTRDNFIVLQFHNVIRSQIFHTSQHHVTCFKPLLLRLNNFWPERGCYPYSQWVIFPVHNHLLYRISFTLSKLSKVKNRKLLRATVKMKDNAAQVNSSSTYKPRSYSLVVL